MEIFIFDFLDILLRLIRLVIIVWVILYSLLLMGLISLDVPAVAWLVYIFNRSSSAFLDPFRHAIPSVLGIDMTPVAAVIVITFLLDILHNVVYQEFIIS